ncbi:MAG: 5-formyltetrahydrofolate cyclo-ligase [Oscillospiraceae bacterium]|jgi:5-formyltetrahydrofolate cyclo-ligase|nr:5-formyltetrahydrofolate cyclo-ligase [Oscillospiraceae bacterium]
MAQNLKLKKQALREQVFAKITAFTDDELAASDNAVFEQMISHPRYKAAERVMFYYSVNCEVETHRAIEHALAAGKTAALPVSYPKGIMEPKIIAALSDAKPGRYGIPAPDETAQALPLDEIDLVIVPALAFDKAGYRLGYGGGYYDRFVPRLNRRKTYLIGLGRQSLLLPKTPRDRYDCAVDEVILG